MDIDTVVERYYEVVGDLDADPILSSGSRAAVRATWRGTADADAGPLAGADLVAHVAALITVEDGLIRDHETFDCYEPLPG